MESDEAMSTTWSARSCLPLPDPPPPTLMVTADWLDLKAWAVSSRNGFWKVEPDSFSVAAASAGSFDAPLGVPELESPLDPQAAPVRARTASGAAIMLIRRRNAVMGAAS